MKSKFTYYTSVAVEKSNEIISQKIQNTYKLVLWLQTKTQNNNLDSNGLNQFSGKTLVQHKIAFIRTFL